MVLTQKRINQSILKYPNEMRRTRYKIVELTHPHFVTCTVLHWLPIFRRKRFGGSGEVLVGCFSFCMHFALGEVE